MGKILKNRKNIIFLLFSFIFVSCVHPGHVHRSCDRAQRAPVIAKPFKPQDAIGSMVLIIGSVFHGKKTVSDWYGSGTIVGHNEEHGTMVLTAGHVCVMSGFPVPPEGTPPLKWKLKVVDKNDVAYEAKVAFVAKEFDACLINVDLMSGPALELGPRPLIVGDTVTTISAPFAVFGAGVSLIYEGRSAGTFTIDTDTLIALYTIPSAQGSSGAPILDINGKIVGLVSQVNGSFHHITISPTHEELETLFAGKAAIVRYAFPN